MYMQFIKQQPEGQRPMWQETAIVEKWQLYIIHLL